MEMAKITEYARALYEAHGDKAEAEAAQKARQHEDAGDAAEAETWRAVRKAISEIGTCQWSGVEMTTASIAGSAMIARKSSALAGSL